MPSFQPTGRQKDHTAEVGNVIIMTVIYKRYNTVTTCSSAAHSK